MSPPRSDGPDAADGPPAPVGPDGAPPARAPLPRRQLIGLAVLLLALTAGSEAWRQHAAGRWGEPLAARARPGDIQLISSVNCPFCTRARQYLTEHAVPFDECFIERDATCLQRFHALGGAGTPLVLVRGQVQLGFVPEDVARVLGAGG